MHGLTQKTVILGTVGCVECVDTNFSVDDIILEASYSLNVSIFDFQVVVRVSVG